MSKVLGWRGFVLFVNLTQFKIINLYKPFPRTASRYPILDTRISFVRPSPPPSRSGYPPDFCNRLDWRALVELSPPNIGKLRGYNFFVCAKKIFSKFQIFWKKWIFEIFWNFYNSFFSGLGWTGELWSNCVFLILRNKDYSFFYWFFFL